MSILCNCAVFDLAILCLLVFFQGSLFRLLYRIHKQSLAINMTIAAAVPTAASAADRDCWQFDADSAIAIATAIGETACESVVSLS